MFCKNCGTELVENTPFCSECGTPAEGAPESTPIQPEAPVVPKPKKKKTGLKIFLSIVAIVLVLSLVATSCLLLPVVAGLGIFGGLGLGTFFSSSTDVPVETAPHSQQSPKPTIPDSAEPTEPTTPSIPVNPPSAEKVSLVLKEADLVFEMTDADVDLFYQLLDEMYNAAMGGEDGDTVMALSDQVDEQYYYLDAQLSIASVLYYCDLDDEEASQLYLDCTDILSQAYNDYMEVAQELYDAEFPAKDRFFAEWTEQAIAILQSYTPEIMELEQRSSEILVAYQDMQNDDDMYTEMVPLYIEMVQINNRLAQFYGYDNYYDYAYAQAYNRDYGADEIAAMREYTAQYLVDAAENAYLRFYDAYSSLSWTEQSALESFMFESYQDGYVDEIEGYLGTLPQSARDAMLDMFNGNIVIATNSSAMEGAFTTTMNDDNCLCFFGPGYIDALTVMHEVGHYYGGMYTYLNDIPLDLAETQSQGNEWLFLSYLATEMDSDFYEAVVNYKTYNDIVTILLCVVIDEFEERVYTHPNIDSLTSDDLDALMVDVCANYGGIDYLNDIATDVQSYWRLVVVEQPVYYISYAVSALAAMNIYTVAEGNYQQSVDIYCKLNENVDLEIGFLGNLENAGLNGPFDEKVYQQLYAMVS